MNWMPIETAPKDGTQILLFSQSKLRDPIIVGFWAEFKPSYWTGYPDGAWLIWEDGVNSKHVRPTHWMPLPPPPTVSQPLTVPPPSPTTEETKS